MGRARSKIYFHDSHALFTLVVSNGTTTSRGVSQWRLDAVGICMKVGRTQRLQVRVSRLGQRPFATEFWCIFDMKVGSRCGAVKVPPYRI